MIFDPKKGGSFFLPPSHTSLKTSKKWVSSGGGVKLTIQPLGVGSANRPKKAQNGGICGVFPCIRLPGFDLTTSARRFSIFDL